jgi:cytochrome c oxidase cbb3-type subunit 3
MSERDEDRLLDHEYDGIREYDNPLPRWWLATLWGTVIFAVLYFLNVIPGLGEGRGWHNNYAADSTAAAERRAASDPLAGVTEATLSAVATTPAQLEAGRIVFATYCVACHLADGGGSIGPNLTDPYWIHGGRPLDIFTTVRNGVLDKGMPAWSASLSPDQVIAVAGYVLTLRGTTPAQPKAPQGTHIDSTAAPAGSD